MNLPEIVRKGRRCWRAETVLFLALWLLLMVGGRSRFFRDPGTFWHIVTGQKILSTGHFLESDPYSFTFGGRPWVPYEWLAECFMAAIHALGGLDGLLLATATALAGLYTWLAHRLIRSGLHAIPAALVVALALLVGASHFHARPHVGTLLFFGITCGLLCDFEAGRIGLGRLVWLFPMFVVWTNWHGGMLGGLATLVLAAAGWLLLWLVGGESPVTGRRQALRLALLVLACGLSMLVNPYGERLPRTWLEIMGSPVIPRIIEEHRPPDPRGAEFWLILLTGLAYASALASTWPRRPRVTWLIPLVWLALSLSRVRHASLYAIVTVVALADLLPFSRFAAWLARPGRDLYHRPSPDRETPRGFGWRPVLLPMAVILAAVVCQAAGLRVPVLGRGWARLDPERWPVALLPDLRRIEAESPGRVRIFNDYALGGFLIFYTPRLRVFIDDRCELYGDAWLSRYVEASRQRPEQIESWARRYGFEYAMVAPGSEFAKYLQGSPLWRAVGRTTSAVLYRRSPLS